ncbi:MAG: serine/threonine-protein kinase [Deltaproteobacteria bacterium]|nr:serine/threonine-protein kinase [Deltaproteobacteria bacterium]
MQHTMFGRYLLLDKVAAGGMAEVWRGKITGEANFQRIVAIKKILPHVAEDEDFITMFTDEALITASLQHANIGQVYEFSKIGDVFFIAMEYISGRDLKSLWSWSKARNQIMPLELSSFIVAKMADGLDYAHSRRDNLGNPSGIVHRDISPQNVLVSWEGDVKVIDFGIAKATEKSGKTRPGTLKGKFAYMAPEQIRGLPLDGRSDIFALGVVLYEMVTGQRGFQADSEFSLLEMVRNVEIRPPSLLNSALPAELERIVYKALCKDRDQRYQTGADLSEDLQRFLMMRGKPPQARDLAAFMRENFTVDWEKERARLESYKEFTGENSKPTPVSRAPAAPIALEVDSSFSSSDDDGFSSSAPPPPPSLPPPQPIGVRPAALVNPVRSETTANTGSHPPPPPEAKPKPSGPSRAPKILAAMLFLTVLVAGLGVGGWYFFRPRSTVVLSVEGPAEAFVRFDNAVPAKAAPSLTFEKIEVGTHIIVVEAPGYTPATMTIVTDGEPLFPVKAVLKRVAGKLTVMSDPSGATIFLDGRPTEKRTPATFDLPGDTIHEIRLQKEDYKEAVKSDARVPGGGGEATEKMRLFPSMVRLRVVTTPEGAMVKVGGVNVGLTPVVIDRQPDDPYPEVEFTHDGCEPMKTTVPFDREKADDRWEGKLKCR